MEDVVAVRVDLGTGESRYFMTWGRIQDVVDPEPLEALVMRHASGYDLGGEPARALVCFALSESYLGGEQLRRVAVAEVVEADAWQPAGDSVLAHVFRPAPREPVRVDGGAVHLAEDQVAIPPPGAESKPASTSPPTAHRDPHRSRQGRDLPPRGRVPSAGSRWIGPSCCFGHQAHRSNDRCPKRHFRRASTPR
jgi:hypothetical protein